MNEELLEKLYWEFDSKKKEGGPSERDVFKGKMRFFADSERNKIVSCDQVSWLLDIADRYLPKDNKPRVSREREMLKYAMLYEVMEIVGVGFEDDNARWNGTPNEARDYPKGA